MKLSSVFFFKAPTLQKVTHMMVSVKRFMLCCFLSVKMKTWLFLKDLPRLKVPRTHWENDHQLRQSRWYCFHPMSLGESSGQNAALETLTGATTQSHFIAFRRV